MDLRHIHIPPVGLPGTLRLPHRLRSLVVFAQGSGSSRFEPRNVAVAEALCRHGFATLLLDLLTFEEERNQANIFSIPLLAARLIGTIRWIESQPDLAALSLGLFATGTGAAAALVVAANRGQIRAIVTYEGRPDLAHEAIDDVRVPTLMIVGGHQDRLIEHNRHVHARLKGPKAIKTVATARYQFAEPDATAAVVDQATRWFGRHLAHGRLRDMDAANLQGDSDAAGCSARPRAEDL
ncbi:dienelactone hydrolase family protein [Inquilinus limosus]|uniref:dienelactone hydrolase family protein n=1 Tax=Inquilinus limosus TaxID=171674 RepID=UPI000403C9D9|nr:dienelactone hydrolase family protein [Inquilinus limosus]